MTTRTRPQSTRPQNAFAEKLAEDFASVEVRVRMDGIALIIGHEPFDEGVGQRCWTLRPDGGELSPSERIALKYSDADALMAALEGLDRQSDDFAEQARALFVEAVFGTLGCGKPADYEDADLWKIGIATRRLRTKGGVSQERGDIVIVRTEPRIDGDRFVSVFSPRRVGLVATPLGYVEVVA